jgi:hypothetical protein
VSLSSTDHLAQLGLSTGSNLAMSNTAIQARNNGAAAALNLNPSGGDVAVGSGQFRVGSVADPAIPDYAFTGDSDTGMYRVSANTIAWSTAGTEGMRLLSNNTLLVGKTAAGSSGTPGVELPSNGQLRCDLNNIAGIAVNINSLSTTRRAFNVLLDNATVGGLNVDTAGVVTLVAYQAGHWSQLRDRDRPDILPGTLVETIDEFCEWFILEYTAPDGSRGRTELGLGPGMKAGDRVEIDLPVGLSDDGKTITAPVIAEVVRQPENRHPKFQVCGTAASRRVFGAFKEWCSDENGFADAFVVAAGLGHVRMAKGQQPRGGDLLMSDQWGCAVVQDDDVVRASTVGKVAADMIVETYRDGSFLVVCDFDC